MLTEDNEELIPKIHRLKKKHEKKTMLICGFYGYDIPCPYLIKMGKCNRIHCPIIKEAFDYAEDQISNHKKV